MEVNVVSKKLIKPCVPTPQDLKVYKLSFLDELSSPIYVPFFFFYSSTSTSNSNPNNIKTLEKSLSKILPQFYPFSGRYIHNDSCIDCNDEGAEFLEADANIELHEFIKDVKQEQLHILVQRDTSSVIHEATDPVISIQVTTYKCGGLAIGLSFTHRIVDADSMMTFMAAWTNATRCASTDMTITPTFDSPTLFPFKNLLGGLDIKDIPITRDPNVVAKRLLFDKEAIMSLKARTRVRASRVRVVCALMAKALIGVDSVKHGHSRGCIINQAVNMRARTIPPLPKHSCGNLVMQAPNELSKDNVDRVGFEELVTLLGDAIEKTIRKCANMIGRGKEGHNIFLAPIMEQIQNVGANLNGTKLIWLTDCTKFGFYDVTDFGWGKPIWASIGLLSEGVVVLMEDTKGDGIEVLVHLNKNEVAYLEEDEDIKLLCALNR